MDRKRIKKAIIENFEVRFDFVPHPSAKIKGVYPRADQELGFLFRKFTLDQIRQWCGLSENDDAIILGVLDDMSAKRQIKIFRCEISRHLHYNDVGLVAEIGRGLEETTDHGKRIVKTIFYWQTGRALSQKDFLEGDHTVLKPSEQIKELRRRRDEHFRQAFGWNREAEIEKEIHSESLLEEAKFKESICIIAESIKERKSKEKNA
jgi:hypothetical protein